MAVYAQVRNFSFVNFDDPAYVYENEPTIRGLTGQSVVWAFTTGYESNWHPLTWLSHMLDCQLFGLDAGAHHLVNAFFHLANSLLLFAVIRGMTGVTWRSAWVTAIFAVHPAHAESVAWVSERKDLLSTFFGLLSLHAYVSYVRRPRRGPYVAALLAFVASLLAKQMLMTLPILLLLLDVWPLQRIDMSRLRWPYTALWPFLREKLPFLATAIAAGCVAVAAQSAGGSMVSVAARPLATRVANALVSYVRYLGILAWPRDLTFFYPYRPLPAWQVIGAVALLAAISVAAIRLRRRCPYLLVGWLWYLIVLLPVIGLVQAGEQAFADRYTYFSSIGLCVAVAWGVADALAGVRFRDVALTVAALISLIAYGIAGAAQVATWRDSRTLLAHALEVTPDNAVAQNNLGYELLKEGRVPEAMAHFQLALRLAPGNARAHQNLGRALQVQGDSQAAIAELEEAVRLNPRRGQAQRWLADALAQTGHWQEAVPHYRQAIAFGVDEPEVRNNLGVALASGGDVDGALREYRAALALEPEHLGAHANAARALAALGHPEEALTHLQAALRLREDDAETQLQVAEVLAQLGRNDESRDHLRRALQLRPGWPEAESLLSRLQG